MFLKRNQYINVWLDNRRMQANIISVFNQYSIYQFEDKIVAILFQYLKNNEMA